MERRRTNMELRPVFPRVPQRSSTGSSTYRRRSQFAKGTELRCTLARISCCLPTRTTQWQARFRRFEMLRHLSAIALLVTLASLACSSNKQQQPTAEEQKKIQQEQQNAAEEQKQLTSGYDQSMQSTPPSTGYNPKKDTPRKQQPQQQSQQKSQQQ